MQLSPWFYIIDSNCEQWSLFESQFVGGTKVTHWISRTDCEAFESVSNSSDTHIVSITLSESTGTNHNNKHWNTPSI